MTAPKWYDFTQKRAEIGLDDLIKAFGLLKTERFVIGEETGIGGYEHYQCRIQFKKPYTMNELRQFNERFGITGHWSPTSEYGRNFDYCEKEGRFYRSWEGALAKFRDIKLKVWQGQLLGDLQEQNDRQVTVVVDEMGNQGKSWLAKHLVVKYNYAYVPAMPQFEDYMFMAMAHPDADGFIFDLPRADTLQQKKAMWMAMETIKNGYLYDKRYAFKEQWRDPPKMVVFANERPPREVLSRDRWREYYLTDTWGDTTLEPVHD